jgi:hypothetical protein
MTQHLDELKALMSVGAGRPIAADQKGMFVLRARNARINGSQLRYEPELDALGYWRTSTDRPEWRIKLDKPTVFDVVMTCACPSNEAGSSFGVHCTSGSGEVHEIPGVVKGTASWGDHQDFVLGRMTLPAGAHVVCVSSGKNEGPLMKLRRLSLVPVED